MSSTAHGDGAVGTDHRLRLDPERADFPARQEHHMRRRALELVGADRAARDVDRSGLQNDELRADVQRGIG